MTMDQNHLFTGSSVSGEAYEPLTGRWSRQIAPLFLDWIDTQTQSRWLDVGCGTGALIQALIDTTEPAEVVGIDSSSSFIAFARKQIRDPRVRYEVGDARMLPVASSQYDVVAAALLLNHVPPASQLTVVREMARAARIGGVIGAYVWDYREGFEPRARFWESATLLDEEAERFDERECYSICEPEALAKLFRNARINAIETAAIEIEARFTDFDDYWLPFLAGYGKASAYTLSLTPEKRQALRDHLRSTIVPDEDGSITMRVRTWAVKGVK
jgi:SAM-dependent methyltransferase